MQITKRKIVSILPVGRRRVKNITVKKNHNFILSNGILTHNSGPAQDLLKGLSEEVSKTTRFIFTANNPERIIAPLKSRAKEIYFKPVEIKAIGKIVLDILKKEKVTVAEDQKPKLIELIKRNYPDIRKTINHLEYFSNSGDLEITFEEILDEDTFEKVIDVVKAKKFSELREILKNNRLDYDAFMKKIFHSLLDTNNIHFKDFKEGQRAEGVVLCGEYMYRSSSSSVDKETNFATFAVELMRMMTANTDAN
jgi:DNA polymerase III delta prime subunit